MNTVTLIGWFVGAVVGAAFTSLILLAFCIACGSLANRPLSKQTQWWIFGVATCLVLLLSLTRH